MSGEELKNAIASAGYAMPRKGIVWDGKLHRFATDPERPHSQDGWYVAYDDAKGRAAAFGSWRDDSKHTWSNGAGRQLSETDWAEIERQKRVKLAEERQRREQAAQRAQRLYEQADRAVSYSGYLARKGIGCPEGVRALSGVPFSAFGFRRDGEFHGLVVPLSNAKGDLRSLQLIAEDASQGKLFMAGGETARCFHVLGEPEQARTVLVAEGLATAQSLYEACALPVYVAFSAGNVAAVAAIARERVATADVVVCADDDEAGRKGAAASVAAIAQARWCVPGAGCNDFNDLHQAHGLAAVRAAVLGEQPEADEDDWRDELIVKHKDDGTQLIPCRVHNLMLILTHAPEFRGRVRFNEFSSGIAVDGADLDDAGPTRIKARIEKEWIREKVPTGDVNEALLAVAREAPEHPVRDYLESLAWDGTERIEDFFSDIAGCPKDDYHMAVARSLFVSAVARIFKPGCKVDTMVILESMQGLGKTSLWVALFGEWCAEVTSSLNDKDFFSGLRGVWCADFGELDQFSRAESTRIKQVITQTFDHYRPHYGRQHQRFPRQCIFVGGTNQDTWQTDSTGGRRFLPVRVRDRIDVEAVAEMRDQLWAEAVARFERGDRWWDIPDAGEHQEASYVGDTWEEMIQSWLIAQYAEPRAPGVPFAFLLGTVLTQALGIEAGKQTRSDQTRAGNAMRRIGWTSKQEVLRSGGRGRVYRPSQAWIDEREATMT